MEQIMGSEGKTAMSTHSIADEVRCGCDEVVRFERVHFTYLDAPQTIHDVSLSVRKGECCVLMGASGSGKTTITRLINGLAGDYYRGSTVGRIELCGTDVVSLEAWQRSELVGSVFQDPSSQFFSSQLAGEVAFGCENLGYGRERVVDNTDVVIARFGLDHLRTRLLDVLSSGQKQKVAIASAMAVRPQILVMDEPSANLDEESSAELGATLKALKEQGCTIIIAEHRIAYLMDIADHFYFVTDGRVVSEHSAASIRALTEDERLAMGVRSPGHVSRPDLKAPEVAAGPPAGLALAGVSLSIKRNFILSDVAFSVSPGQILALTGPNGAGKTTLAKTITGLRKADSGTIGIDGEALTMRQLRQRVWYSSNDLSAEFFTARVIDEIMLLIDPTEEHLEYAHGILSALGLSDAKEDHPSSLSGGQKQRLSIACGLIAKRAVLILDEPTSGLDAVNMHKLAQALRRAADEGQAVIVITHDNEFMRACCTHQYVLGTPD